MEETKSVQIIRSGLNDKATNGKYKAIEYALVWAGDDQCESDGEGVERDGPSTEVCTA